MPNALLNNRYELLQPLGTGGMAQVYQARDHMLERSVAIKVLRANYANDEEFQERFRQEAKAAANLSHPNIVTVHDFGFDQGYLFIVMEHVPGVNLKTMIENLGKFSVEDALPLIIQACAGIGYAHRAGLVHCDVKPHNMLVTPDHRLKVTDFGIARAIASIHPDEQSDVIWGSPLYFSPEQAAGGAPSPASDVYSLGVVLYEILTGRPPFSASTAEDLAKLHRESLPVPPSKFNPKISPELEKIILKVLSKEPAQRYRTADQLGRVLMTFGPARQSAAEAVTTPPPETSPQPAPPPLPPAPRRPEAAYESPARIIEEELLGIDWISVGLALLALLAVGLLIPFWLMIYYRYAPYLMP
ncbi:MAG: hypothetical protein Fur0035_14650 [Anaerolineales bacterium]